MTQSFVFQDPVGELGQGVFPGPNMMPSWKHPSATFNLLPNDLSGHKRRRSFSAMPPVVQDSHMYNADHLQVPTKRLSNDSLEHCPTVPHFFVDLDAAASQSGFLNVDNREYRNIYSRTLDNSCNSLRTPPRIESTHCNGAETHFMDRISSTTSSCINDFQAFDHTNGQSSQTFNHYARSMGTSSAAAVAAQALTNFQAESFNPNTGFLHQRSGPNLATGYMPGCQLSSSSSFFAYPSTTPVVKSMGNVIHNLADTCNQDQIHDLRFCSGGARSNGNIHLRAGVSGDFNWKKSDSHTSSLSSRFDIATNVSNSSMEVTDHRLVRPQSPSTPRVDVRLSESQQGFLEEMQRLNAMADQPDSPRQNTSGRRLEYSAPLDQPSRNPFQDFEAPTDSFTYKKCDHLVETSTINSANACVTASESTERTQLRETMCRPCGPTPLMAVGGDTANKESSNHKFDLNEVPGLADATPKPRKKFHPRVAKDKRTYKRRVDVKRNSGAPVVSGSNMNSQAKKTGRRAEQTSPHDFNNGDSRESTFEEAMDVQVEDVDVVPTSKPVSMQHDTAVCDCEDCIKLRLERRALGQNTKLSEIEDCAMGQRHSEDIFNNAKCPVSPPDHQGRGSWGSCKKRIDTPDAHDVGGFHECPNSGSNSSSAVRRNLFDSLQVQASAAASKATWLDQGIGCNNHHLKASNFDANHPSGLVVSPRETVRVVIHHPATTGTPLISSLMQFNQSGTHLDVYDYGQTNLQHLQNVVAQHRDSMLAMNQRNLIYPELHSNMTPRNYAKESGTAVPAFIPGRDEWNPWFDSLNSIRPAVTHTTNNSYVSRLCPRGILSPQKVPFRMMNQIQRVVYLKFILRSNHQLEMSPKMLLHHVLEHLPESEKEEFKSLWDVILTPVGDDQMRQLAEHAQMEIAMPASGNNHTADKHHTKPEKAKKPSKRQLQMVQSKAMTLWPDLMQGQALSNPKALKEKVRSKAADADRQEQQNRDENEGLEMVPYENKSVVPYDGPFLPLRKRKPRAKVVLDNDTVREWKLLMGKPNSAAESVDTDPEKELKWEERRRKMKAQAQTFIERMHIVQGDRSFSCWKGSVVDSVVGAFLTQNVNDVLSSSAFISMRSRFPGRGFRRYYHSQTSVAAAATAITPEQTVAQSIDNELAKNSPPVSSASATSFTSIHRDPQIIEPQSSASLQDGSSLYTPSSPARDVGHSYECSANLQESHNVENNEAQSTQEVTKSSTAQITHSEHSQTASAKTSRNSTVETAELQSGLQSPQELAPSNSSELCSDGAHNALLKDSSELLEMNPDATTQGSELIDATNPSHGRFNPKTGLTGLERAKIEERQVSARKSFDFSHLEEGFRPRQRPSGLPRTEQTEDGVDWEAVRRADVAEVADVIKERGLNWILAGRIKAFLERLHLDYGALDLEWLRSMSTDQTKDFLLSIHGLGLKSVECIRLLTLHHLAFPVDTNVGRICVRLGWVPLEPLPEELQLHLLEMYPVQATIQKYLWPRLCKLDHQTLYELHYQMISFGKVFCTKSKPNCNACPMRPECKHFASAVSSAKLALPASGRAQDRPTLALPPDSVSSFSEDRVQKPRTVSQYCQPIVEEPMTPESEANVEDLDDIEDYPFCVEEVDEEAVINLCIQESRRESCSSKGQSCKNPYTKEEKSIDPCCSPTTVVSESKPVQEITLEEQGTLSANSNVHQQLGTETCLNSGQDTGPKPVFEIAEKETNLDQEFPSTLTEQPMSGDTNSNGNSGSQEMVLVPPEAASIPVPKLKNVGRLRTVHYVYELPDNHPLLDGLDSREVDDPCTYLLAIWGPGEVPESIPNINDNANEENPFASSSSEGDESIKATLLVPCRTAMQGSFPLNGTYFQVNEVFADHASSLQPILVPRTLLWNLRRRFVFFGTSVTSIFRGMTAEEIQACFWRGYVCVRGFDRTTRAPKPLVGRLHLQAGKSSGKGAYMEA